MSEDKLCSVMRASDWVAVLLAVGALGVSGYLSYVSLISGESPAGCGAGSGCAAVVASKWSRVWGVPVSLLAVVAYLDILFALYLDAKGNSWARRLSGVALTIWAAVIVGSAGWFVYLQVFELDAICPYCMTGHGLGVALVVVLVLQGRLRSLWMGLIGLAGVLMLITVQVSSTGAVTMLKYTAGVPGTTDRVEGGGRIVRLLNGQLTLNLSEEPLLGSADAEHVIALMFDYACPHCRHTHGVLGEVVERYPGEVAVLALPTPMNPGCNEHVPGDLGARFSESCELARIALAVFVADRTAYPAFDRWMYDPATARTAAEARSEAIRRVGAEAYEQAYTHRRTEGMLAHNVEAYGLSGADRVPVLVMPGGHEKAAVVGRVDRADQVIEWLGLP